MPEAGAALAAHVGDRLESCAHEVARAWLDELDQRLATPRRRVFPESTLLDHIPALIRELGAAVREERELSAEAGVIIARLARLRRSQGYTREEIGLELELLGDHVFATAGEAIADYPAPADPDDVVAISRRAHLLLTELERLGAGAVEDRARRDRRTHAESLHLLARAINHELNNRLLAARFSLAEATRRFAGGDPDGLAALDVLGETMTALEQVAGDVFTVALTQSREAPVLGRWQPLRDLVRELIRDVRGYAGQRQVEVRCQLDEIPEWWVDASRVQLVLVNLVVNAVKYSDPDATQRWLSIEVVPEPDGDGWIIAVADNGLGIPTGARRQIFDPDYRVGQGDQSGEGIGLAVAREAAAQLSGRLTVESTVGKGSVFQLHLPEPPMELPGGD